MTSSHFCLWLWAKILRSPGKERRKSVLIWHLTAVQIQVSEAYSSGRNQRQHPNMRPTLTPKTTMDRYRWMDVRLTFLPQHLDAEKSHRMQRGIQYSARLKGGPRFGEFYCCSCLPLLPGFACIIHATWGPTLSQALHKYVNLVRDGVFLRH